LIIRVFSINQRKLANEWTFESGSWSNTTDTLPETKAAVAGEPVAASRSSNGTKRYIEYLYTAPEGRVNYLARNSIEGAFFYEPFAEFDLPRRKPPLSTGDIIGIATGVIAFIGVIISAWNLRSAEKRTAAKQSLKDFGHRCKKLLGFSNPSPRRRENKGSDGSEGNSDPESLPLPARNASTL